MKSSAAKASRKWPCRATGCDKRPMVSAVALVLALLAGAAHARPLSLRSGFGPEPRDSRRQTAVPLPKPRPPEAPAEATGVDDAGQGTAAGEQGPPPPSPCRLALTEAIAIAPSIPAIHGPGNCGGDDLVRLEAVVLADGKQVAVKPAAILRCTMAAAIADWVRGDVAPLAERLGTARPALHQFPFFPCRRRPP